MNLQELQQHFPSLQSADLEMNYFILSLANEFGIDEVKLAVAKLCVLRNACDTCEGRDGCPQRARAATALIVNGVVND